MELQKLTPSELDNLNKEIQAEYNRRQSEERQRMLLTRQSKTGKIISDCGHFGKIHKHPGVYPSLNIGLKKPFAILHELCPECAKDITIENFLTDERWDRVRKILEENGEKIPNRKKVAMQLEKVVMNENEFYAYAVAS